MSAFTAGQKVRASTLNAATISALIANGTAITSGLRIAYGTTPAVFSAASFASCAITYSGAGFTAPPTVIAVPNGDGSTGRISVHSGTPTTTGTTLIPVTTQATNITATITIAWLAIGI